MLKSAEECGLVWRIVEQCGTWDSGTVWNILEDCCKLWQSLEECNKECGGMLMTVEECRRHRRFKRSAYVYFHYDQSSLFLGVGYPYKWVIFRPSVLGQAVGHIRTVLATFTSRPCACVLSFLYRDGP